MGVTHCCNPHHVGVMGAVTHVCTKCDMAVCLTCRVNDHLGSGHTVLTLEEAAAAADAAVAAARADLMAGAANHMTVANRAAAQRGQLGVDSSLALTAVDTGLTKLIAELTAQAESLKAAIGAEFVSKDAALEAVQTHATSSAQDLVTTVACMDTATSSSDPCLRFQIGRLVASMLPLALKWDAPLIDTTMVLEPDNRDAVLPLGNLVVEGLETWHPPGILEEEDAPPEVLSLAKPGPLRGGDPSS